MQYVYEIYRSEALHRALAPLAQLPWTSWLAIAVGALIAWTFSSLAVSFVRSLIGWLRSGKKPEPLLLVRTNDHFIRINKADDGAKWLGGAKLADKESGLLLTYIGDDGKRRRAPGTVWFTVSKYIPSGTVGIPDDIATELGLSLNDDPTISTSHKIQIEAVPRFFLENLWNNADDSIKISFRTTVWVTFISTVVTVFVSYAFEYLVCRGCLK